MPSLQIANLTFNYEPGKPVIDNLSVVINNGETWSIIGKNGSGKSTLIRCIARLEPVKRGAVFLDTKEILDYSSIEMARKCAYVPQATLRIPPSFTVLEYVLMGRYPYCGFPMRYGSDDRKIAAEAMELTDTVPFAHRSMRTLSGGELQRVFIAGAVAQRTAIMLLDEPVSFLDSMHQEMIHATLDRIHREYGTTLITVTHDINAALQRSTHVLALVAGKQVYAGATQGFLNDAASLLSTIYGITFEKIAGSSSGRAFFMPQKGEVVV
ncbi:MAG: ABC transporter ATP-binding protein [Chitinispirillaceae bacterium]|nr:ABC transporter ATP-binding protein [Chitinispirillaceae bacterium]